MKIPAGSRVTEVGIQFAPDCVVADVAAFVRSYALRITLDAVNVFFAHLQWMEPFNLSRGEFVLYHDLDWFVASDAEVAGRLEQLSGVNPHITAGELTFHPYVKYDLRGRSCLLEIQT